jgi:hypothetical protein
MKKFNINRALLLCTCFLLLPVFSTIAFAGPAITSIAPNTAAGVTSDPSTFEISNLAGTGFEDGATVVLTRELPDTPSPGYGPFILLPLQGRSTLVESSTKIVGVFFFEEIAPGSFDVVVTNPDGQSATLTGGFTVTE